MDRAKETITERWDLLQVASSLFTRLSPCVHATRTRATRKQAAGANMYLFARSAPGQRQRSRGSGEVPRIVLVDLFGCPGRSTVKSRWRTTAARPPEGDLPCNQIGRPLA